MERKSEGSDETNSVVVTAVKGKLFYQNFNICLICYKISLILNPKPPMHQLYLSTFHWFGLLYFLSIYENTELQIIQNQEEIICNN